MVSVSSETGKTRLTLESEKRRSKVVRSRLSTSLWSS